MPLAGRRWSFSATVVSGAPEASGVFGLYEAGELVYLGSTAAGTTLRSALAAQLRNATRPNSPIRDVTHYAWEIVGLPDLRELQLLDEFRAQHGKAPRCNEALLEASSPAVNVAGRRREL